MTTILKGSEVVESMNAETAATASALREQGVIPTLVVLRVGEREDAIAYETGAAKRCEKVGVDCRRLTLSEDITQEELVKTVMSLNDDSGVHGVLMLRPLPAHIDDDLIRNTLDPGKDIDGITDISTAGVFTGESTGFAPCTAQACIEILDHYDIALSGKKAAVIGRSLVIGRPVAMMLLDRNATVTICHSRTENLPATVREADIVIACVGRARMVDEEYLKAGQTVIDVGINVEEDGALVGDVDFAAVSETVSAITPVPGGVGAVTTSVLVKHVVAAAQRSVA